MSSASEPPPRTKSSGGSRSSGGPRQSLFLPIFIFLIGACSLAFSQYLAQSDQLDQLTQNAEKLDLKVKRAHYEKTKFFRIAVDVLQMAAKDPNAKLVSDHFRLQKLAEAKPELLTAAVTPVDTDQGGAGQPASTNAAPVKPLPATNAPPK